MTRNLRGLLNEKRTAILETARRHGARNVRIFGPVARGDDDEKSDLDFLVELEPGRTFHYLRVIGRRLAFDGRAY